MLIKPFETERLRIRPLEKSDAPRLFLLDSNPDVMQYVGIPPLSKPEESEKVIEMIQAQYEKFGVGRYAVVEKENGILIGWNGLKFNTENVNGSQNFYELGYRFLPEFWGKGYAQESSKGVLTKGFHDLNLDVIYAYAHSENTASNNALQKLGFEKRGEFEEPDGICFWYELKKENFKF